jgi:phospholipase C
MGEVGRMAEAVSARRADLDEERGARGWGLAPLERLGELRATRRAFLAGALAAGGGALAASCGLGGLGLGSPSPGLGPGTLPDQSVPAGTDLLPKIDHIVVVMLENRSFDHVLGMLGRGDGFPLGADGEPTTTNPNGSGERIRSFHLPSECRSYLVPNNSWDRQHEAYDGGRMDGFVTNGNGPAAMGYYDGSDLPFTYGLANTFPISDRYFSSVMGPTFPNRRYLLAATSLGLINDYTTFYDIPSDIASHPPNGTILDQLNAHGISWKNYFSIFPTTALYSYLLTDPRNAGKIVPIPEFFADAKAGTLPAFSIVDPNYLTNSEGEGQDIQFGDGFLASIVNAVLRGPKWSRTLLVWTYDESGGYFDHVAPPSAPAPDDVAPQLGSTDVQDGFDRYGFRLPMGLVCPYAKPGYVSHEVADHASIVRLVETKWNLPALTERDANAHDLLDMVDFSASPAFLEPPSLPAPANALSRLCLPGTEGSIPPPGAVLPG